MFFREAETAKLAIIAQDPPSHGVLDCRESQDLTISSRPSNICSAYAGDSMTLDQFSDLFSGILSIVTTLAIVAGGIWAYYRFVRQREGVPIIQFSADIAFVDERPDGWIVELLSFVENKGKAQHRFKDFVFDLRALNHTDAVTRSDIHNGQVEFPDLVSCGSWLPKHMTDFFVDPGVTAKYSHLTFVSKKAATLVLHSRFSYPDGKHGHVAEKSVAVPHGLLETPCGSRPRS